MRGLRRLPKPIGWGDPVSTVARNIRLLTDDSTDSAAEESQGSAAAFTEIDREGWSRIEKTVYEWLYRRKELETDDHPAPTREVIGHAIKWVTELQNRRVPALDVATISPDGEIAFESHRNGRYRRLTIGPAGGAEFVMYVGGRLAVREVLTYPHPRRETFGFADDEVTLTV